MGDSCSALAELFLRGGGMDDYLQLQHTLGWTSRYSLVSQYESVTSRIRHLKAYNMTGKQVGIVGVGTGRHFCMFPATWQVCQLTNTPVMVWVKVLACPAEDEVPRAGTHYELMQGTDWRPSAVILNCSDGTSRPGH